MSGPIPRIPDEILVSPAFLANPYDVLAELRRTAPVYFSPSVGGWILTAYDDIVGTFKDTDRYSNEGRLRRTLDHLPDESRAKLGAFEAHYSTGGLLHSDPPAHTRLRRLVLTAFTPPVIESLRPFIRQTVDELLDAAAERGGMDVIEDLAFALPVAVLAKILGVPRADAPLFRRWADDILAFQGVNKPGFSTLVTAQQAIGEARAYLANLIEAKRQDLDDSLLARLVVAESEGDALSPDELLNTCVTLLVAGHETTTSLIGNGILALLQHPAAHDAVRADPALVTSTVEEALRLESPVARQPRLMRADVELRGETLRTGDVVFQMLNAANRDPAQFANPDHFDIRRSPNRHIAFGLGPHFCVGAPLARAEGQIAIRAVVTRFPRVSLVDAEPHWDLAKPNSRVLRDLRVSL
jgi:pimeloyl-[acyl-carrier protein] synthase